MTDYGRPTRREFVRTAGTAALGMAGSSLVWPSQPASARPAGANDHNFHQVEKIVELKLTEDEKQAFDESAAHVKDLVVNVNKFLYPTLGMNLG